MKKLVFVFLALVMFIPQATVQADSRPFVPYLWAREMSIPYFAFGVPDKEAGKFVEGVMLNPPTISLEKGEVGRVFFLYKDKLTGEESHCFFRLSDLTGDPRETEWWQKTIYRFPADNLRKMVDEAASVKTCPEGEKVTDLILADMVARGYATKDEIGKERLPLTRTREIMRNYTGEIEIAIF